MISQFKICPKVSEIIAQKRSRCKYRYRMRPSNIKDYCPLWFRKLQKLPESRLFMKKFILLNIKLCLTACRCEETISAFSKGE